MDSTTMGRRRTGQALRIAAIVLAVAGHVILLVPFTVASGLLAPLWAVIGFHALWLAAAVILVRTARRRPLACPLVPVAYGVLLWVLIAAGGAWLGWSA